MLKRMTLAVGALLAASVIAGTPAMDRAVANPPLQCKWQSFTVENGKTFLDKKCSWKYGCDCRARTCLVNGRWRARGPANCINLPG
ncbi:MAG TPA: hypothetical protein PK264_11945 [Hyphomicrobiaceae bacterium]|nr:hypothetical protein [Hyphomicrobiaceae bacterium]